MIIIDATWESGILAASNNGRYRISEIPNPAGVMATMLLAVAINQAAAISEMFTSTPSPRKMILMTR